MFKINPEPTFTNTVKVRVPDDAGFETQTFQATFKVISTYKAAEFDFGKGSEVTDFLRTVVVGVSDVADAHGTPLSDSEEMRDMLFGIPYVRPAFISSYFEGVSGAQLGN